MRYVVEVKGVRPKSIHCFYTADWESPGVEPCVFDTEADARQFYRDCIEDEDGSTVHAWGIRREGESHHFLTWNA